ncbi:LLM class flavin-dependent oxidoreductase [Mycoplasma sp. CSL10137]|uniref:LLM class flavin-dependent oxidoreductase n=1 Tax=unclassified Mycoplasma TaxID=2683645 RepID=UPI00197C5464|nr:MULTISPECIES: LLM class flavin-dependent oxidoreductase [unclassified Mycoplasma]MBN4083694.1 LLM class flavin-dependent oxidoreductase [Mycoplasma sp. CSL10137]MBN4084674.1 LLM class flavin-dependent oxidoreductase [Mycoplasma sp. CSL10166]MBU4693152.1 LLM class flavin-dependent oxidoreductase [Mycoplasma sp. CSL7491-lung]
MKIELGISTFGETTKLESTGKIESHHKRIKDLIEEMVLADEVGLDVFAVGEHHRDDFAISSPEMILAAGAVKTKNIILTSAVTVLSSNDPIRVYQNFAHVDLMSDGRAEIMVGRGSFTESFPLFGYQLRDYDGLFDEKLDMLLEIKRDINLNWKGTYTQTVENKPVYPRALNMPIWVATGGNPNSTIDIATRKLPIVYAIIGGNPHDFKPLVQAYRAIYKEASKADKNPSFENMKVGSHSWGYIDETDEIAAQKYWHPVKLFVDRIASERPHWTELTKERYERMIGPDGAVFVGSPETVAKKIISVIETVELNRFLIHLPVGSMDHKDIMNSIRLFGEKVAPIVRKYFEDKEDFATKYMK